MSATKNRKASPLRRPRMTLGACLLAALLATASVAAGAAWAAKGGVPGASGKKGNHCLTPEGVDGNELLGVSEQLLVAGAPPEAGCGPVESGEPYIPLLPGCWEANDSWEVAPADYTPAAATPVEDFVSKVQGVTYVVDPDTRQARTYRFRADDIVVVRHRDLFPISGTDHSFVCILATLPPLPPGNHAYDVSVEMSARSCDGIGTREGEPVGNNCLPAGKTLICGGVEFTVVNKKASRPRG